MPDSTTLPFDPIEALRQAGQGTFTPPPGISSSPPVTSQSTTAPSPPTASAPSSDTIPFDPVEALRQASKGEFKPPAIQSNAPPPPAPVTATGVAKNAAAGTVEGGAGYFNILSDPFGNLIGKPAANIIASLHDYFSSPDNRFTPEARQLLLGDTVPQPGDRLVHAVGNLMGAPQPDTVQPQNTTERLVRKTVPAVEQALAFSPTSSVVPAVSAATLGTLTGDQAAQLVPDWAKPGVETAAAFVGGAAGAKGGDAAVNGVRSLAGQSPATGGVTLPDNVKASNRAVVRVQKKIEEAVGPNGQQAIENLPNQPATSGYTPTLAEAFPDKPGAVAIEQQARADNKPLFAAKDREQADSEAQAIQSQGANGNPADVRPRLIQGQQDMTSRQAADQSQAEAARQAAINSTPQPKFQDTPGNTAAAQYGAEARTNLLLNQQSLKDQRAANIVDPEGQAVVPTQAVQERVASIYSRITPSAFLNADETRILGVIKGWGDHVGLDDVVQLQPEITAAISRAVKAGDTTTVQRLTQLKGSLDLAIKDNTPPTPPPAPEPVAPSSEVTTVSPPQQSPSSEPVKPLSGSMQRESLVDFLISKGGIQDQGGDLKAIGADDIHHKGGGRLVNPNGMPLDYAREAAVGEGFLPQDATIPDLLNAIAEHKAGRPVYRPEDQAEMAGRRQGAMETAREAQARSDAQGRVSDVLAQPGSNNLRQPEYDHAVELVMQGMDPEQAVREAAQSTEERVLDTDVQKNSMGEPGLPPSAKQTALPVQTPQRPQGQLLTDADRQNLEANRQINQQIAQMHDNATGKILAPGDYPTSAKVPEGTTGAHGVALPDAAVMQEVWNGGAAEGHNVRDLIRHAGKNADAQKSSLLSYIADDIRARVIDPKTGEFNRDAYAKYRSDHREGLAALPEIRDAFDGVDKTQKTLEDMAVRHQGEVDNYNTRIVTGLINDDPVRAAKRIFASGDPDAAMADIMSKIGGDKRGLEGLKAAVMENILSRYRPPTGANYSAASNARKFVQFIDRNQAALVRLYGKDGVDQLRLIGQQVSARTHPNLAEVRSGASGKNGESEGGLDALGIISGLETAREIPVVKHVAGPVILGARAIRWLRSFGIKGERELLSRVAADPGRWGPIVKQMTDELNSRRTLSPQTLRRLTMMATVPAAQSSQQPSENSGPTPTPTRASVFPSIELPGDMPVPAL